MSASKLFWRDLHLVWNLAQSRQRFERRGTHSRPISIIYNISSQLRFRSSTSAETREKEVGKQYGVPGVPTDDTTSDPKLAESFEEITTITLERNLKMLKTELTPKT